MVEPLNDGSQDGSSAVSQGEIVVPGGQAAPLLHVAPAAFDDVATSVCLGVQVYEATATRSAVAAVLLVPGFGDHLGPNSAGRSRQAIPHRYR